MVESFVISSLLIGLLILVYSFIGFPILTFLRRLTTKRLRLLLSPVVGWMTLTTLLSWGARFELHPITVLRILVIVFLGYWLFFFWAYRRRITENNECGMMLKSKELWLYFTTIFLIILFMSVPSFIAFSSSLGDFGFVTSIGPDAIGYAVSGQTLAAGTTLEDLGRMSDQAYPGTPSTLVISPLTVAVNSIPSFSTQIGLEFITGAGRIGYPASLAAALQFAGFSETWRMQHALAVASLVLVPITFLALSNRRSSGRLWSLGLTLAIASSSILLYTWTQGGVGQVWIAPALLMAILAVSGFFGKYLGTVLLALSIATMASSYQDALVLVLMVAIAVLILRLLRIAKGLNASGIVAGFLFGLLLYPWALLAVSSSYFARSTDGGQAGWQVPFDLSLPQILNFSPLTGVSQEMDQQVIQTLVSLAEPLLVLGVLIWVARTFFCFVISPAMTALLGSFTAIVLIFVGTQVVSGFSNYQLIKTIALLIPIIYLSITLMLQAATESCRNLENRARGQFGVISIALISTAVLAQSVNVGSTLLSEFIEERYLAPTLYNTMAFQPEVEKLFGDYAFVTNDAGWDEVALASLGDFRWLNRSGIQQLNDHDLVGDISWMISREKVGMQFARFELTRGENPLFDTYTVIPLKVPGLELSGLNYEGICSKIGPVLADLTLQEFSGCHWLP